jgi:hypothetical protein
VGGSGRGSGPGELDTGAFERLPELAPVLGRIFQERLDVRANFERAVRLRIHAIRLLDEFGGDPGGFLRAGIRENCLDPFDRNLAFRIGEFWGLFVT